MVRSLISTCALLTLLTCNALCSPERHIRRDYAVAQGDGDILTNADIADFNKSGADTFCMLSHLGAPGGDAAENYSPGPGNLFNGDFQDDYGMSSWDGWTCVDYSQKVDTIWHIDTYFAVNGSFSYWCGENYPSCDGGDPVGGYGNSYEEFLDYWAEVGNPNVAATLNIAANINYDNEPGYDFLYLQYEDIDGMQIAASFNGYGSSFPVVESIVFAPSDYVPHPDTGLPSCHLRWVGDSDGAWSDADCDYPSTGLAQIDDILVSGANSIVTVLEDCEDQMGDVWRVTFPYGVGAFCWVWPELDELDECCLNQSPQFAFIDDGNVVPGTGGTPGITWTYGPGGYIVNPNGGLAGDDWHIRNEIWSPVLDWPGDATGYDGGFVEFSVYRHLGLGPVWAGIFYIWHVRSSVGDPVNIEDAQWRDRSLIYYGGPECTRHRFIVSDLLEPGRTHVQLALGITELCWSWGWEGTDASSAPYYDNARFCAFELGGPAIAALEINLAQDNFPEIGDLSCADPCGMHVRFDMAKDISLREEAYIFPGDSIAFDIVATRTGTILAGMPELYYKLNTNPLFNTCRTAIPPGAGNTSYAGCTPGDFAREHHWGDIIPDRYVFDLPDSGFFYPGDQIHYFIRAADTDGYVSTLPADTGGFSHFPGADDLNYRMLIYPGSFTVRALPSIGDLETCEHPSVLWWNDAGNRGPTPEWMHAWWQCGYEERQDFDIYYTNGPSSGVGNGLGGRATPAQLLGYQLIAYSSGDMNEYTITKVNYYEDGGDDLGVLTGWFDTGNTYEPSPCQQNIPVHPRL